MLGALTAPCADDLPNLEIPPLESGCHGSGYTVIITVTWLSSSRVWQRCWIRYLVRLSTEYRARVSINTPGWGSVNLSRFTRHPPKFGYSYRKGRGGSWNNCEVILTLIIHWLGHPLFLLRCSEATLVIWSERLAKGPYQKNTPSAVRLEPVIYRLQTDSLSYDIKLPAK